MYLTKTHRMMTHLVVAVTTAAIMFYSEQALACDLRHDTSDPLGKSGNSSLRQSA